MDASFDGIIVGAGHNGLILQAYLCRLGLRVVAIDRNPEAGGGLSTFEDPAIPGVFHNPHSVFHRAVTRAPWFGDLALAGRGVRYLEPELNVAVLRADGGSLRWYTDVERTCASVAEFSRSDARTFREIAETYAEMAARVIPAWNAHPPLPEGPLRAVLDRSPAGRRFLAAAPLSAGEFARTTFHHPQVQALMLFLAGAREVDMNAPGHGWLIPALIASPAKAQLCVGGSAALARGLVGAVEAAGGEVWTGQTVRSVLVEGGHAVGAALADGTRVRARLFVASTLNPQQTVLELAAGYSWPAGVVAGARGFRYNEVGPLFGINVALREPPRYQAQAPDVGAAFMTILGLEEPAAVEATYRDHPAGRIARPLTLWGAAPSVHDASQARAGYHTAFMWEKVPYALDGDARRWDAFKTQHAREVLDRWAEYAPNVREAAVASRYPITPLDTERRFPNMAQGDLCVGWMGAAQLGANRPTPELAGYATPLPGLYMAGACMHPGGNITGYPGYVAAGVIARDLGLEPWWSPPDWP
jgi:phytoene dehydrogenase-like protein